MNPNSSIKLEVDPSIIKKNLVIIAENSSPPPSESFDQISKFLGNDEKSEEVPWKYVRPSAGFCAKTHTLEGDKVFLNICYTDDIPPPKDVSDEELIAILESDEAPQYTVPLSLGSLHVEVDKSGNPCSVYDIAINSSFYNKILINELFKTFFMTVALEGVQSKYNIQLTLKEPKPYVVLKNRKNLGIIQLHRIQQRNVRENAPKKLIEVISSSVESKKAAAPDDKVRPSDKSPSIKEALSVDEKNKLRLFAVPKTEDPLLLLVLVKIKALTGNDIELDISSERLIVSCERNETIDCVLPYPVLPENAVAQYFVNLQVSTYFITCCMT